VDGKWGRHTVTFAIPEAGVPLRIVSLLPSATEIVCALGLEDSLVGVTHECDWPPSVRALPRVTRTLIPHDASSGDIDALVRERLHTEKALYTLDLPVLEELRPDLLVTQALCDVCAVAEAEVQAAACSLPGQPRVVNLEPETLEQVFESIAMVGDAAGCPDRAHDTIAALRARVQAVADRSAENGDRPRVVVLEWLDPLFTCGHWTPELVRLAGGDEVIALEGQRSRTMSLEELLTAAPDVLVISCCGLDVERTMLDMPGFLSRPGVADLPAVRSGRVHVIDGNAYLSRPGPRLVDSLEIMSEFFTSSRPTSSRPGPHVFTP
jgi:iron complex transport system substrate-binding protein